MEKQVRKVLFSAFQPHSGKPECTQHGYYPPCPESQVFACIAQFSGKHEKEKYARHRYQQPYRALGEQGQKNTDRQKDSVQYRISDMSVLFVKNEQ